MALTDAECRSAKPRKELFRLSDAGGLQLWVAPSGTRTWRLKYRFDGIQRSLTFGTYPELKLVDAREKRDEAKRLLRAGVDPGAAPAAPENTEHYLFKDMMKQWLEKNKAKWSEGHYERIVSRMDRNAIPEIGHLDVREIDSQTALAMLRKIEDRDAVDMAKRVRQSTSSVFKFCVASGIIQFDPCNSLTAAMKAPPKVKHRASLKNKGLGELVHKIKKYDGEPLTALALLFTLHTMVRTKETRFAAWSEFEDLESAEPLWRIPAERMKMGLEHMVPLSLI